MLAAMVEEPIAFLRAERRSSTRKEVSSGVAWAGFAAAEGRFEPVRFERGELERILTIYGRMVAAGAWRDYALDFRDDRAVFSVFRRASEMPLYMIEKRPRLKAKQGQYSVVAAGGEILRRGHELAQVLRVLEKKLIKALAAE